MIGAYNMIEHMLSSRSPSNNVKNSSFFSWILLMHFSPFRSKQEFTNKFTAER